MTTDELAFENFFHDYVMNKRDCGVEWGHDYWQPWGVMVKDSQLVFDNDTARTWFLLRWA